MKRISGSTTTVYIFSGSKVIDEYDNGAALTAPSREYIYGGALLAKIDSTGTNYYHQDHLSNRLVTNSSGAVVGQMGHFPYGDPWYNTSNDKLYFTTYERNSESDNDYAQARFYRWLLGRFLSPDPLSGTAIDPQSLNRYSYTEDNPINATDPSGMDSIHCNSMSPDDPCVVRISGGFIFGSTWNEFDILQMAFTPTGEVPNPDFMRTSCLEYWDCGLISPTFPVYGNIGLLALLYGTGDDGGGGGGNKPANNGKPPCISTSSLNWSQRAQLTAAQFYANLTGWTFGFGAGLDAGAGVGPKRSKWNFGGGGSGSTLIVADASGNAGFLNSVSGGFSAVKMSGTGRWGAGAAAGPSFLVSPNPISTIAGPSGSISAGGGLVLGAGASITTSGAATFTFGVGAGAEAGISPQGGTSQFIPFCHN
ncbi:MAG TPA: RHS repeat-associated core domain-containing protein [Candidatus Eisenbacteria bacterium]|nr:RHS repeat-associated core domain-containing protein [Candidatus Eisenbacteria bacterium]